jgi:hypothetical protein
VSPGRAECPVLTCTRDMPAGQVMCTYCWAKVPKDLRKSIDSGKYRPGSPLRGVLVDQAISAAQAAP